MTTDLRQHVAARIQLLRQAQGLSLSELARGSNVAKATRSKIETGEANPTLDTLWQLSNALKVPASHLMETPDQHTALTRASEGTAFREPSIEGVLIHALDIEAAHLELYYGTFRKDQLHQSPGHRLGVVEHIILHSGALRVEAEGQIHHLGPGDYLRIGTSKPHSYLAEGADAYVTLIMAYPRA